MNNSRQWRLVCPTLKKLVLRSWWHIYPVDNYNDGFAESVDVLKVQISTNLSKTYSDNLHKRDRNLSFGEQNRVKFRFDYFDAEVFNYANENKIIVLRRLPLSQLVYNTTEVVEYSEKQEISWAQNEALL